MSNGKFVASVENKSLRKYTDRDMIQGTAPAGSETAEQKPAQPLLPQGDTKVALAPVVSPLSEMEKASSKEASGDSAKKTSAKKPVKVARKGK